MLITLAPGRYVDTHGPALLNSASVLPFGLSAPTETTGTVSWSTSGLLPSLHGVKAAGYDGRLVASLPAEVTTTTPLLPRSSRIERIVGSKSESSGVSW